jgi:uncharacterized delta-60 repeat protein
MKKQLLFISTLLLNLTINAQIGTFDPNFNNGSIMQVGNYGSGQKIISLSNENSLLVNNYGISSPDYQSNTETGYLTSFSMSSTGTGVGTYSSFCELISMDQFSAFTDFYKTSDGKITVVGYKREDYQDLYANIVVGRYLSDGSFDASFNGGSFFEYNGDFLNFDPKKIAVQSNGKIVIAGGVGNWLFMLRLNSDGTLDNTFANNGSKTFYYMNGTGATINDMKILSNDKIVIAGADIDADNNFQLNGFVARLTSNGITDSTFGTNGFTKILFGEQDKASAINSMAITSTGKIIVAGYGTYASQPFDRPKGGVLRLSEDGAIDLLQAGIYTHTQEIYSVFYKIKLLNTGGFVVVGNEGTTTDKMLFCFFDSYGYLNTNVDTDGIVSMVGPYNTVNILDFDFQPDGKLIFTGNSSQNMQRMTFIGRLLMSDSNNGGGTNGIDEVQSNELSVFPNPMKEQLTITTLKPTSYKLTDLKGNILFENSIENNETISTSTLEPGMYFIESTEGQTIKLIKE